MKKSSYKFEALIWIYPGDAAWHFLSVPKKISAEIKVRDGGVRRGFGSVPVTVTIGKTKWRTSIYPEKESGVYILPLKKAVRKAEKFGAKEKVTVKMGLNQVIKQKRVLTSALTENGMTVEQENEILKASEEAKRGINVDGPFEGDEVFKYLKRIR